MDYFDLKSLHVLLALTSISGFIIRWIWMRSGSVLIQLRSVRILPHVIDSLFLATGIWLAFTIQQFPFTHAWLTAKVLGLVAYVLLGSLALKRARSTSGRILAFAAAVVLFAWIVSVARSKSALGFLGFMV